MTNKDRPMDSEKNTNPPDKNPVNSRRDNIRPHKVRDRQYERRNGEQ